MRNRTHLVQLLLLAAIMHVLVVQAIVPEARQPYAANRPAFVLLGDSLTEFGTGFHWKYNTDKKGWVPLLAEAYSRKADIINRGLSGYNSRWGLLVLPHTLADFGCLSPQQQTQQQQQKAATRQQLWGSLRGPLSHAQQQQQGSTTCSVQLLLIWYGANDLVNKNGPDGRLHVSLAEYKQNLAAMVQLAKQAGVQHIMLATPPPVVPEVWAAEHNWATSDRTNAAVEQYAAGAREVAQQLGVPLLDIQSIFTQPGAPALKQLLNDGVHFGPPGHQLVAKSFLELIDSSPQLTAVKRTQMPNHYPKYDQIDPQNPGKTFQDLFDQQLVVPGHGAISGSAAPRKDGPTV